MGQMTSTPEIESSIDIATINGVLGRRGPRLRFPPALERLFEIESGTERARQLVMRGSVGLLLFVSYLVVDATLTPDTFWIAVILRLGIVLPIALILVVMGWYNRAPFLREAAIGVVVFLAVLCTLTIMLLSDSPLRDAQADSIVLTVLFITLLQRLRFVYSIVTSLAIYAAFAWGILHLAEYPAQRIMADIAIFGGAVTLALIGSWHAEQQVRKFYLLNLRSRLLNQTLADMSRRDALTGLENRRALDLALGDMRANAREGEDIAVSIFDLDHFKAYNDGLGHMAGDICLKRIATIAQNELRAATDVPFRFGGEEFLILFRRTDLPTALAIAERMRRAIEAEGIPHPTRGVVTASFGVAATRIGSTVGNDELMRAADAALYAAKRNGRNQVWPPFLHKGGKVVDINDRKQAG
jgi:diguanylate cyclase (GGDEF)-like protein